MSLQYDRLLEGKFAVVTSGAHGMGKYIAKTLIRHGATCAVNGMNPAGEQTAEEFRRDAPGSFFVRCDMSDKADTENFIRQVKKRTGRVDIIVNNVGINRSDFSGQVDDARFEYTQQVNLYGVMRIVRGFLPLMKENGGSILHISTIHSVVGMPPNTAYASSKSAINAYSGALAAELAPYGIRSNVINPGAIYTGGDDAMFEEFGGERAALLAQAREVDFAEPDYGKGCSYDIADTALFLLSGMARRVTGAVVNVDGGTVMQAHRFYERRLPDNADELWLNHMRTRFVMIDQI